MSVVFGGLLFLVIVGIPALFLEVGYQYGVKETERRWSEAVRRKESGR